MKKIIELTDKAKRELSIQAIKKEMSLKKYIEWFLEKLANNNVKTN